MLWGISFSKGIWWRRLTQQIVISSFFFIMFCIILWVKISSLKLQNVYSALNNRWCNVSTLPPGGGPSNICFEIQIKTRNGFPLNSLKYNFSCSFYLTTLIIIRIISVQGLLSLVPSFLLRFIFHIFPVKETSAKSNLTSSLLLSYVFSHYTSVSYSFLKN